MSGVTEQIKILYENGHTPEEICAVLVGTELTDILLVLNSLGLLTKKKIKANRELNGIITSSGPMIISDNSKNMNTLVPKQPDVDVPLEDADAIYKRYRSQVALRLCETAMATPTEEMPASVITKAQIYVNEEATGRNEARAKKNNMGGLLQLGEMLQHIKLANVRVNSSLGLPEGEIEVLTEKVA